MAKQLISQFIIEEIAYRGHDMTKACIQEETETISLEWLPL